MGESPGEGDPLLLPAGELPRHPPVQPGEPHHLQQLLAPAAPHRLGHAADRQGELHVLRHRHATEQGIALEHEPDPPPCRWQVGDIAAMQEDPAAIHLGQPGDHPQERALAAARRPEQHEELPVRHLQGDVVDHRVPGVPLDERFDDDGHVPLFLLFPG